MSKVVIASLLKGTLQSFFRINSVALKVVSGVLQVRNNADSADANVKAAAIQLTTGAGAGLVLTSDASGNGVWQTAPGTYIVGEVKFLAHASVPTGWLLCDGSAVSRGGYPQLFTLIGTKYGAGDGSTTFNLPNTTGKFPVGYDAARVASGYDFGGTGGEDTHVLAVNEIPSHTHAQRGNTPGASTPARSTLANYTGTASDTILTSATGGGAAHENRPPWAVFMMIIYAGG